MNRLTQTLKQKLGVLTIGVVLLFCIVSMNGKSQSATSNQLEKNRRVSYKVVTHHERSHPNAREILINTTNKLSAGLERKIDGLKRQGYEVNQLSSCVVKESILYTVIMKKPL